MVRVAKSQSQTLEIIDLLLTKILDLLIKNRISGTSQIGTEEMRLLWDFLLIISIAVWVLGLALYGYLSTQHAALVLFLLVLFIAMIKIGGSLGRLIRKLFRILLPIATLVVFVTVQGQGNWNQIRAIFALLLPLFIALFGIYIMFHGLFGRKR